MARKKLLLQIGFIFGTTLLVAGLFFNLKSPVAPIKPTLTTDRLAKPALPANPSQADKGAQVYWLSCLPCHGERGQGLTDEFITTYPKEDRNCWKSGCHGKRPYQNGFALPTKIPALIGANALKKFPNAAALRSYIFATMPYWKPASLTEEEAWQVVAFILRENHLWADGENLSASNADSVLVGAR
jgi:cytochrome c